MKPILLVISTLMSVLAIGQSHDLKYCGQYDERVRLMGLDPVLEHDSRRANEYLEEWTRQYAENRGGGDQEIYIIPVVFHVIHDNGDENISDEQILNGLSILNRDFRKQNSDTALVVDAFEEIVADIGIEFRLATKDPQGNCTTGINRIQSELTYEGNSEMKSLIYWPRNKYLNIWICSDAAGAAGYTNLPGDVNNNWVAWTDGIVIRSDYVGNIGTSNSTRSRTLTHEVGHWLNLYHTWGQSNNPGLASNCNMDDLVDDTPNTVGYTECTLTGTSCSDDVDNVQNYMEYSYCSRMFTEGQRIRMRAAITSAVAQRNQLITTNNHINTGVINPPLCMASFSVDRTAVCVGEPVLFTDNSYHGIAEWTWDFGDGTIVSGTDPLQYEEIEHQYQEPGIYTIELTISNGDESLSITQEALITVFAAGDVAFPLQEGFEAAWPGLAWAVNNVNDDLTWEITPSASYTGTKSIKLRNFNNTIIDNTDEFISAPFDMSAMDTIFIDYKWSYANKVNETDDRLRISTSGDCGATWGLERIRKGLTNLPTANPINSAFTPSGLNQWNGETLIVTDETVFTENFQVKFEFIAKGGNNLYLDDINIYGVDTLGNTVQVLNLNQDAWNVLVYPNPAEEIFNLEVWSDQTSDLDVRVYNAVGQLCYTGRIPRAAGRQRTEIRLEAAGAYTLVVTDGKSVHQRVIIRR